jgi:hypothetical protein
MILHPKLGGKTVTACVEVHEPGFNGTHPITFGVTELYEGATFARLPENLVASGWIKVLRSSEKHLVTAVRPPSNQAGPMIIHGACALLSCCHVDAAALCIGQEAFVVNMAAYSALRPGDTSVNHAEDFNYHASLPPPIGLERADERSPFVNNDKHVRLVCVFMCVCVFVCVIVEKWRLFIRPCVCVCVFIYPHDSASFHSCLFLSLIPYQMIRNSFLGAL